jgi:hypothetical protein
MYLNETYSNVHVGKHSSGSFLIKNCVKQGDALSPLFFNFSLEYAIRMVRENQVGLKLSGIPSIIRMIKSWRMRWSGHVSRTVVKRDAYGIVVGKPERTTVNAKT